MIILAHILLNKQCNEQSISQHAIQFFPDGNICKLDKLKLCQISINSFREYIAESKPVLYCVYKIKIGEKIVHVGRSDTCKKHGGAEKVRKALVNLLNLYQYNPSVPKTKVWDQIRLQHKPNSSNTITASISIV